MRALFCLLVLGCATVRVPPLAPTLAERRAVVLRRDIAWTFDTIPLLRFDPPYIYGAWRLEVEQCSGLRRDGWPVFYVANKMPVGPHQYYAYYAPTTDAIVFGLGGEAQKWLVQHELLHYTLAGHGIPAHDSTYYGDDSNPGRCWHVVRPST